MEETTYYIWQITVSLVAAIATFLAVAVALYQARLPYRKILKISVEEKERELPFALIDFDGKPLQIRSEPLIQIKIQNRCHTTITLDSIFLKRDSDYENLSIEDCLLPETTLPLQVTADNYEELKINRVNLALSLNNNLKKIRYLDKRLVIFLRDTGGKEYKVNLPGKAKEYADFGGTKA